MSVGSTVEVSGTVDGIDLSQDVVTLTGRIILKVFLKLLNVISLRKWLFIRYSEISLSDKQLGLRSLRPQDYVSKDGNVGKWKNSNVVV